MRRAFQIAGIVGIATALALAPAVPALAHNYVVSSTPTEGETVSTVPEFFIVTTNENMLDLSGAGAGFAIQITDDDGLFYGDGCVTTGGPSMSMLGALGAPGGYTMSYQFVSADGHTLSDSLTFRYEPTDAANVAEGLDTPPVCGQAAPLATETETAEPAGSADADRPGSALGIMIAIAVAVVVAPGLAALAWSRRRGTAKRQ
jgi:methionine-rich copper-binding protein CopC